MIKTICGKDFFRAHKERYHIYQFLLCPQDDVVMGTLTVRENIAFSAALRLPSIYTRRDRGQKVDQVIKELGLTHVADSKVSDNCG